MPENGGLRAKITRLQVETSTVEIFFSTLEVSICRREV
jgi:hypothetical protein